MGRTLKGRLAIDHPFLRVQGGDPFPKATIVAQVLDGPMKLQGGALEMVQELAPEFA